MTNRLLLGIAGLWWGGRDTYTIHASDCVTARSEQLDVWHPPSDHKAEGRTRAPGVFNTWLRYAENSIKVFGSCYGVEHVQERLDCLQALKEAHEEDEHAFPASYCIDLFEELVAAWCEGAEREPPASLLPFRDGKPKTRGSEDVGTSTRA